jgi:hypothetical protein
VHGKPRIKFIVAIWGERYIDEFSRVSLSSYLAPGNLPALAAGADLEMLVMTSEASVKSFEAKPIFSIVRRHCPIRYIHIDDLITNGLYGVTLTLAYARGIRDSGAQQTDTVFVFMNSDFVLADGSLRTLLAKIETGARCVMAPSLRVSSEQTVPRLRAAVDDVSHTLSLPPREMVQIAFRGLHPTVVGKTVTQNLVSCSTHNQIYWQVDETALLVRHHLIFMLAIKPEVPVGPINSYCDYGFVPELVPSGDFAILDDSDHFCMIELQARAQESEMLRGGDVSPAAIGIELSRWTTPEHRRFAETDIVFHTGELPAGLARARRDLADFLGKVRAHMTRPVTHVDHFYWVLGVQAWVLSKYEGIDAPSLPPELSGSADQRPKGRRRAAWMADAYAGVVFRLRQMIAHRPNMPIWHYLWLDYLLVRDWLRGVQAQPQAKCLAVCAPTSSLGKFFQGLDNFTVAPDLNGAAHGEGGGAMSTQGTLYDHIFIYMPRANMRNTRAAVEAARTRAKPTGTVSVFVEHVNGERDGGDFSKEFVHYVDDLYPADWVGKRITVRYAGGRVKRRLRIIETRLHGYLVPSSVGRLPHLVGAAILWPAVAVLTAINNAISRRPSGVCPPHCSSFLLSFGPVSVASTAPASDKAHDKARPHMEIGPANG